MVEDADLRNGLLFVGLRRVVPEALKPRRVPVGTAPKLVQTPAPEVAQAA